VDTPASIRQAEFARLRAAQAAQNGHPAGADSEEAVAPAGVSERNRAQILAKIDAIEAQMRAQWAAPSADNTLRR
jgi:hypothetical protein